MPPSAYAFHSGTQLSPQLLSFVHARVLGHVDRYAAEYTRLAATLPQKEGEPDDRYGARLLHAWEAERTAHNEGLRVAGWTPAAMEVAARYV